ncbi:DUF5362 family protein [Sporosalibacterium faouarense]|uniref:DUF5362 family protein n=1 Tax=Sporosalibacterium faouarense TaxID=516123 RepID=UPI00141C6592|nr:DUF5362 family protein [Sporosalibacterium faouarense]MTI46442.1 hypothetical protein [Bacillota bacterium]
MENNNQPTYTTPDRLLMETLSKWVNFVGIMTIISGILSCISIVGIIPGVLAIILGLKLRSTKASIDLYLSGSSDQINSIFENLGSYFKIQGILIIISLALGIISFIIAIVSFISMSQGFYY